MGSLPIFVNYYNSSLTAVFCHVSKETLLELSEAADNVNSGGQGGHLCGPD